MKPLSSIFVDGAIPGRRLAVGSVYSLCFAGAAFLTLRWLFVWMFSDPLSWYPGTLLVVFLGVLICLTPNTIRWFFGLRRVPLSFSDNGFEREHVKTSRDD